MAEDFDFSEVEKLFPRLSRKNRKKIVKELLDFPEIERRTLLELALNICKQNRAGNVNYLIALLNEWVIEGVQTRAQAVGLHDQNYGELLPDVRHVEVSEEFLSAMDLWKD